MVQCQALDIELTFKGFSIKLEKLINNTLSPPGRPTITGSHAELFEYHVRKWEAKEFTTPNKNTFESVGEFIFRTYDVRYENDSEKSMKLKSIQTETYLYRNL